MKNTFCIEMLPLKEFEIKVLSNKLDEKKKCKQTL